MTSFFSKFKQFINVVFSTNSDEFITSVALELFLPVLPLLLEYIGNGNQLDEKSVSIFVAVYILCIGTQSKIKIVLILSLAASSWLTFEYGLLFNKPKLDKYTLSQLVELNSFVVLCIFVIINFLERIYRKLL